jgi:hypothetical protein
MQTNHNLPSALGGRGLLGSLGLGLLSGRGLGGGLGLLGSLSGRLLSGGSSGGLGGSGGIGRSLSDSLLLLVLGLHLLGSRRLALLVTAEESTKDRGTLPTGRALALVLLGVGSLLLGLLLGLTLSRGLSGSGILSGSGGGGALSSRSLLSSLGGLSLSLLVLGLLLLLLLLLDSWGERSEGGLVGLGLSDSGGKLLGLGDLQLDLADPVVTLGGVGSLEGVLVALGRQDKLVGAIGGGLDGIVLDDRSAG